MGVAAQLVLVVLINICLNRHLKMNPYYANWSCGYTLHPSSEASRGAYQVQYGGQPGQPSDWAQIKGGQPPAPPPKAQVFVTASPTSVKTETVNTPASTPTINTESVKATTPATFSASPTRE